MRYVVDKKDAPEADFKQAAKITKGTYFVGTALRAIFTTDAPVSYFPVKVEPAGRRSFLFDPHRRVKVARNGANQSWTTAGAA